MEKARLEKEFANRLKKNGAYQTALNVVRQNSSGQIWLIGGALSREIASILYGGTIIEHDFDFVVENANEKLALPKDWRIAENKFGNPKFIHEDLIIDFIPLGNVRSILQRSLKPTIGNLLSGTPFDVQAIAYDVDAGAIVGEVGLSAICKKRFGINNLEQAQYLATLMNMPLSELLITKAKSMDFTPVLDQLQ